MKRIADIKKMERCEKMLWLAKKQPQPFLPYIFYNEDIYALSKKKLSIDTWFSGNRGDENNAFFDNEEKYSAFCMMRFTYYDLRIKIPIMVNEKNGYHIYFTFASCFPKESEAQSFADQLWVLNNLKIKISKVDIIHLNAKYVREDELDVEELLVVSDFLYNDKNHPGDKIDKLMKKRKRDLTNILDDMDILLEKEAIEKTRRNVCTRRNKCQYFEQCFPVPNKDTSILNLVSSAYKFPLLKAGKNDIAEIEMEDIEGTRHQYAQVMAAKTNALFFDTYAVDKFFREQTPFPISYLDFEWETYAYPPYKNMKPFDVLTFQYSLHIEEEDQTLIHKEYLGKHDCRIAFIENLIRDIPKHGSVMCFNVEGAEKLRLKQLAKQFPQYEEDLKNIWERMIDLAIPFSSGLIYDNRMAGMYSLKKLVAIFTDYNYADLDISHGMEAVRNYRILEAEEDDNQKEILRELLEYCAMDTYAMVLIYHWILDRIKERKKDQSL